MTPVELREYLVRLACEAYDRAQCAEHRVILFPHELRREFESAARERMAQAAQTITLEIDASRQEKTSTRK